MTRRTPKRNSRMETLPGNGKGPGGRRCEPAAARTVAEASREGVSVGANRLLSGRRHVGGRRGRHEDRLALRLAGGREVPPAVRTPEGDEEQRGVRLVPAHVG